MRNKVTALDSFFATLFTLFLVWLISLIPLNSDLLNPIEKTLSDFKLTDIYYSYIKETPDVSEDILMVNIGNLPRDGIAELINILNKYDPAVIGIDAFFRAPKNPEIDSALAHAFSKTKNLVLVSELYENPETGKIDSIGYSHPMFMKHATPGFADMISDGKHKFHVARECIPQEKYQGQPVYSFPVQIVKKLNPQAAENFLARNNEVEDILFQGNINTYENGSTENSKIFLSALDWQQVFEESFEPEFIKNKIIIMGFMGSQFGDPSWEDKFFTPLNENYLGKTNPDMFGVVVHANIVAMILQGTFINYMPEILYYILSVLFIFLNVWFFGWMFKNVDVWWDGLSMVVTLAEVLVLMTISIAIYHMFNYKFDITLPMVALFLMGNLVEIYFGIFLPASYRFFNKTEVSLQTEEKEIITDSSIKDKTIENYEV